MSSIRLLQPHVPVNEVATAALSFEYKAFTEANERVSFFFFFFNRGIILILLPLFFRAITRENALKNWPIFKTFDEDGWPLCKFKMVETYRKEYNLRECLTSQA